MTAPLSPDEGVRAALEAEREACAKIADAAGLAARASVDRQDAKTAGGTALLTGYTFAATEAESIARAIRSRAALSTPVPEEGLMEMAGGDVIACVDPERWGHTGAPQLAYANGWNDALAGLPRGTASAAEGKPVAWFYEFLGHNDQWIADVRLAKPKAPSGGAIRNVRPLSFASVLPSPLPSQGEPAAWRDEARLALRIAENVAASPRASYQSLENSVITLAKLLWSALEDEALAAERAKREYAEAALALTSGRLEAAEARADRAKEALKPFVEHADAFSHLNEEVVIYGSGGLKITVGNLLRARNILKETPHGER